MNVRQVYGELLFMPQDATVLIDGKNIEEIVRVGTTVEIHLETVRTAPIPASIVADL